jgi:peptide/nickel transport system ATP-binding protein/oligopeptide transport system ATP-binding protein
LLRLVSSKGPIAYVGTRIESFDSRRMRPLRKEMQVVFQDPYGSLSPRLSVSQIIEEGLLIQSPGMSYAERRQRVGAALVEVGLDPHSQDRYAHEFSGGQRQRIAIARALMLDPEILVLDEPVSALDVSIQAQVLNLLEDLQEEFDLTYVIIAHDLSVVRHVSDRVAVMYLGKIVELADREALYGAPMHPYTVALMSAVPVPDTRRRQERERILLSGDVPSPISPPPACRFHTRCWKAQEICRTEEPPLVELLPRHRVACHFPENYPQGAESER